MGTERKTDRGGVAPKVGGRVIEFQSLECRRLLALSVTPYNPGSALSQLTGALVTPSTGISVTGSSFVGENGQAGNFSGFSETSGATTLAIGDGIILTSGLATNALGPNNSSGAAAAWGDAGDANLTTLVGTPTFDANSLTLQFTTSPGIKSIGFNLIFGSDEFPEFVGSFNDAFGAYLDGTQVSSDGNGNPLSVNNNFFTLNNSGGPVSGKTSVAMNLQYDGLTPELHTQATLNPSITTHTLKLVIADAVDSTVDSGIFLSGLAGSTFDPGGNSTGVQGTNGSFQFDQSNVSAANTAGTVALTVDRVGGSTGAATVDYSTADGTALAGKDYTQTSGTLTFGNGQTSAIINVPVIANAGAAASTTFTVSLANATGGATLGTSTTCTVTLTNARSLAQFAASSYSVANNAGNATLTVTRSGNTSIAGQVNYATADGTAHAGVNYTATSGTLSFGVGQASKTITVPLNAGVNAPASTFTVTISNPGGNVVLGSPVLATVTIHAAPVGHPDSYSTLEDKTLTKNAAAGVLANDTDADHNPLTAALVSGTVHGALALSPDGSFIYTPASGYFGNDSFSYVPLDGAVSGNVTTVSLIVNAVADHLVFIQQPSNTIAGQIMAPVKVEVVDAHGNLVTTDGSSITLAVSGKATLGGKTTVKAIGGVATFTNLSMTQAGTYILKATDGVLGKASSNSFVISPGTAKRLVVQEQPKTGKVNQILGTVAIAVEDAFGNVVLTNHSNVTVSMQAVGVLPKGSVLSGTKTVATVNGVAIFSKLSINKSGIYTLTGTDAGLANAVSAPIRIEDVPSLVSIMKSTTTTAKIKKLSILGTDTGALGEGDLTYTWSVAKGPGGTNSITFDDNGTNTAKDTPARIHTAGIYHLDCVITNKQGIAVMGSVTITVKQVLSSFRLSPHHKIIRAGTSVQYNGVELDQFGHAMHTAQTVTYAVLSGHGSIDQNGLFTASRKPGHVVIQISVNDTVGVVGASVV
ncbi:MAG TPA: choice-of-anchor L domain-containing protein [Tepidisphaeraceae bacterium]|nr:choice-of-anchor L domain-containing protein [Tepidisphaeraceae bacterium]